MSEPFIADLTVCFFHSLFNFMDSNKIDKGKLKNNKMCVFTNFSLVVIVLQLTSNTLITLRFVLFFVLLSEMYKYPAMPSLCFCKIFCASIS